MAAASLRAERVLNHDRRLPSRAVLAARRGIDIVRGGRTKADLWTSALDDGTRVVVKDFRAKSAPWRLWGRLQVRREVFFLQLLAGMPEVPRVHGRLDAHALVMEFLEGSDPLYDRPPSPRWQPYLLELRRILDEIQRRGVAHLDLRGRENVVLLDGGQRMVVLDWAGALHFPAGSLRRRGLFGAVKAIDDSAYLKWKDMLYPESLTAGERDFLRRFRRWRRLWPFNRKGVGWQRSAP